LSSPTVLATAFGSWALPAVAAAPPANLPHPNMNVITSELPFMSAQYLMRHSGFDGPPGDLSPADGNLPPQVNGWQEFFAHRKQRIASRRPHDAGSARTGHIPMTQRRRV
jgi:hypothetical protein